MKVSSFKKFLEEEDSKSIIQTGFNSKSIDNSVTKEIINSRLSVATNNPFLTPYIALGSIARVLAYVNIIVPQYTFLDREEGEVVFDATQVGQLGGVNLDGSPARPDADHFIYFSYVMNDDGYYDCFAALVDSEELQRILDTSDNEDVDQFDVYQKVNEENVDEDLVKEAEVKGVKGSESSDRYEMISHGDGRSASIIKTHQKGQSLKNQYGGFPTYKTGKHDYIQKHFNKLKVEELKGDQHKLDVAEPKGKLTSADFKKLRGEEAVDEGVDKKINKQKKNKAVADIIKNKIHKSLLPSLKYGRRELKKEEPIDDMSTEIKKK